MVVFHIVQVNDLLFRKSLIPSIAEDASLFRWSIALGWTCSLPVGRDWWPGVGIQQLLLVNKSSYESECVLDLNLHKAEVIQGDFFLLRKGVAVRSKCTQHFKAEYFLSMWEWPVYLSKLKSVSKIWMSMTEIQNHSCTISNGCWIRIVF